jgi:hypothetical protein
MRTIGGGILIFVFILLFFWIAFLGPTGYAAASESNELWDRYEQAHNQAEAWRQKLREEESLRIQRRSLYLQERDSIQRRQDRLRRERERNQ